MTILVTFLVGAATTLAVQLVIQFYVVPRVETRKRREDRWERNVLELGELLTTQVRRLAQEARSAQSMVRFLYHDLEGVAGLDQKQLEKDQRESGPKARQATEDFRDLVNTRVDWLEDRIRSFALPGPRIMGEFGHAARVYWLAAMTPLYALPEHDTRTDDDFDDEWTRERDARMALIKQVKRLADLPHPPRAPWHRAEEGWHGVLGGPDPAGQSRAGRR